MRGTMDYEYEQRWRATTCMRSVGVQSTAHVDYGPGSS